MAFRVKHPGLEIAWLRKHDRALVVPEIVFAEIETSGFYAHPRPDTRDINGVVVDCSRGIIVVNSLDEAELHASTLAHEWRHHWQRHNGWAEDGSSWSVTDGSRPYEERIVEFLRRFPSERDAVMFEHRVAPSWVTDYWLELFMREQ